MNARSMGMAVMLLGLLGVSTQAQGKGRGGRPLEPRYDASLDFSKQFDEEVQADRRRPPVDADADADPPPKHHRRRKRRSAQRRP